MSSPADFLIKRDELLNSQYFEGVRSIIGEDAPTLLPVFDSFTSSLDCEEYYSNFWGSYPIDKMPRLIDAIFGEALGFTSSQITRIKAMIINFAALDLDVNPAVFNVVQFKTDYRSTLRSRFPDLMQNLHQLYAIDSLKDRFRLELLYRQCSEFIRRAVVRYNLPDSDFQPASRFVFVFILLEYTGHPNVLRNYFTLPAGYQWG
jgi:hypothetical protein